MTRAAPALAVAVLVGLSACSVATDPAPATVTTTGSTTTTPTTGQTTPPVTEPTTPPPAAQGAGVSAYGLALLAAPADATHVSVTDFDAIRARLGVPDLTSEDIMTDRLEFWRAAEGSSVLLTDGLLREENSRYDLTYDFTQDDVDAEVRWTGPAGGGFLLALQPDLDLDLVQAAIDDDAPEIGGATLDRATSTVVEGAATGEVWASDPILAAVGEGPAESLMVRRGCVPFAEALGVDATVEDQDAVLDKHDVEGLLDVEAVAIAFTGQQAVIRLAYPVGAGSEEIVGDLKSRLGLSYDWPTTETIGFSDGFGDGLVTGVDGSIGELTYAVTNPTAAANLALADLVPLGVCTDVELLEEPTGL